jgi:hypothetical protein
MKIELNDKKLNVPDKNIVLSDKEKDEKALQDFIVNK